jgi:hypothetical protein
MTAMPDSVDGTGRRHRVVVIGSGVTVDAAASAV